MTRTDAARSTRCPLVAVAWLVLLVTAAMTSVAAAAVPATAPASPTSAAPAGPPPNIVYILCDDLGYGDVSCLNPDGKLATPNMDAIARDGMTFADAHSGSAVCTPTRYGILTGRYAFRTTLKKGVLNGYSPPLVEPGRTTVASLLRDRGYATACVGKWHLGLGWLTKQPGQRPGEATTDFAKPVTAGPNTVGFDYSYIIPASLDMDPYVYLEDARVVERPTKTVEDSPRPAYWRGGPIAPSFRHETVLKTLAEKAEAYIDARAIPPEASKPGESSKTSGPRKPFFLYLPLTGPHTPHVPRPEFRGTSKAGNYGDFVQETDWAVGRVLDALRRNKLEADTIVVLTSDNGPHTQPILAEIGDHAPAGIYRGQKSDAWEGGHRVPFFVRWPGRVAAGSRCDQTVCLTDLLATAADLTGAALPDAAAEDSVSLLPLLAGRPPGPGRQAVVHHSIDGLFAVRRGKWKLVLAKGSGGWTQKEAQAKALPDVQLYDMEADPREQSNVQADHPEVVGELKRLLHQYLDEGRSVPHR
jgi:arylsulfatase A